MKSKATKPDEHESHNLANVLRGLDSTKAAVVSIHEGQTSQFTGKSIMRFSRRSKIVWRHLPSLPSFFTYSSTLDLINHAKVIPGVVADCPGGRLLTRSWEGSQARSC